MWSHLREGPKAGRAQSQRVSGALVVNGPSASGLQDEGVLATDGGVTCAERD